MYQKTEMIRNLGKDRPEKFRLEDYARIGMLYYPVRRFLVLDGNHMVVRLEVIDEPKDEREIRDMNIERTYEEVRNWERQGLI